MRRIVSSQFQRFIYVPLYALQMHLLGWYLGTSSSKKTFVINEPDYNSPTIPVAAVKIIQSQRRFNT